MAHKNWFLHISGQTLGPLTTDAVKQMIAQMRVHFSDFVWTEGFTKWARLSDVDDFMPLMPSYPKEGIPSGIKSKAKTKVAPPPVPEPELEEQPEEVEEVVVEEEEPQEVKVASKVAKSKKPVEKKVVEKKAPEKKQKAWPKIRKFMRVKIDGGVKISDYGEYNVVDISEGGVFIDSTKVPDIGTEVHFTLQTNAFELTLTGLVIRHGESFGKKGFAIEFTRLNPSYRRLIQSYVDQAHGERE